MKVSQKFLEFAGIATAAEAAGLAAGNAAVTVPMVVQEQVGGAVKQSWVVEGGPCGFAWITVRPGTSAFAKFLVKKGLASKAYGGGVQVWVSEFGQSMQRKEAYAAAYAEVLIANGIVAYPGSRMD